MNDSPSGLSAYAAFFLQYGQFIAAWNTFEVMVEVAIMRSLRLTVEESCILTGSLGFGAKSNILRALLERTGKPEHTAQAALIAEATVLAERNSLAHSFISVSEDGQTFTLVRREVIAKLSVRPKRLRSLLMQKHLFEFAAKFEKCQQSLSISDDDLIQYQRAVELLETIPQAPKNTRQQAATNSGPTKRARRRERRAQTRMSEKLVTS